MTRMCFPRKFTIFTNLPAVFLPLLFFYFNIPFFYIHRPRSAYSFLLCCSNVHRGWLSSPCMHLWMAVLSTMHSVMDDRTGELA